MASMQKVFDGYAARKAEIETSTNPLSEGVAWIEGEIVPLAQARIPLLDQGFLHSDLTYDVPAVWDGRFYRLEDHLDRLELGCSKIKLRFPISREEIKRILVEMVSKSGIRDAFVELIVTRGMVGVRGSSPNDLFHNNLYMYVMPYMWVMDPEVQMKCTGSAIITRTVRRIPPGSVDPTVKNFQWGDFVRGMLEAQSREAMYPFLTDGDTNLTEGSGYNILVVKDGIIFTPVRGVLNGVTRKSVIDISKAVGIEVRVETVPVALAYEADEIFMSTTAGGIMPITVLDGKPVKDGKLGPITKTIWDEYWASHYDDTYSFEIKY